MTELTSEERIKIRQFLISEFSLEELKELAFDLGIDYESLPHFSKAGFCLELIGFFERRDNLGFLLEEVLRHRSDAEILALLEKFSTSSGKKVQIILPTRTLDKKHVQNSFKL